MLIGRICGATRTLGKPADMSDDECAPLSIRDVQYADGTRAMMSAWFPTPDELQRLNAGEPVYLSIYGTMHPPVSLSVPDPASRGG